MSIKSISKKIYRKVLPDLIDELKIELKGCESILDLGCGPLSPLTYLANDFYSVGVDIFEPYIKKSKKLAIHNQYFKMNILDIDRQFKPKSFDCVIALDVIEHLEKKEGVRLLEIMRGIAKKKIIVLTPNGFLSQNKYDENKYQIHKSSWRVGEMIAEGYNVKGLHGLKFLRGELGQIKLYPKRFWTRVSEISQIYVKNRPKKAFEIMCIYKLP